MMREQAEKEKKKVKKKTKEVKRTGRKESRTPLVDCEREEETGMNSLVESSKNPAREDDEIMSVSYTHLTLPTKLEV